MVKIYALLNPINGEYFYIGQTIFSLERRLKEHGREQTNRYKKIIMKEISDAGLDTKIVLLAEVTPALADYIEKSIIAKYKKSHLLTNIRDRGKRGGRMNPYVLRERDLFNVI
jgi:hypothetical protein